MLGLHATSFLLAVITAVGWDNVTKAGLITDAQIEALTQVGGRCPPIGTTPNKAKVNDTVYIYKTSLLHWAARHECIDFVRRLLALHANKLAGHTYGWIPLHFAANWNSDGVAALLLADGDADRQRMARGQWGKIPLHVAGLLHSCAVARLLVANCTDRHLHAQLAAQDKRGRTPLTIVHWIRIIIAIEIVGRDSCPSDPAFISKMLQGQINPVIQNIKQIIADVSSRRCTENN